jgi:hypothetical protein
MELTKWHTGCTVESVCLSGAGRQHSNPHARRRLDARVELVYQCLKLAMLGSHSAGRNTVHDTTVPAAAVICNLLAQQHAHHAFFGVLVRSNRLALCSLYMAESECCTNPVYAAVIGTCNCTTKLVSQRLHASDGQSVRTVELAACARLYPSVAQTLCLQQ